MFLVVFDLIEGDTERYESSLALFREVAAKLYRFHAPFKMTDDQELQYGLSIIRAEGGVIFCYEQCDADHIVSKLSIAGRDLYAVTAVKVEVDF